MHWRLLQIFLIFTITQGLFAGNLNFKIASEAGLHQFENEISEPLVRLSGNLNFKQYFGKQFLKLQARLTPEFIGLAGNTSSIKFSGRLESGRNYAGGGWEAHLRARNYFYQLADDNSVYFAVADFGASAFYRIQKTLFYTGRFNYIYRDLDSYPANHLDAFRGAGGLMFHSFPKTRLQLLLEIERFRVDARNESETNKGWRVGPAISLNHQSKILIRSTVRFLYHYSEIIHKPKNEFQAQIVFGKFLNPRLSLFAYLDYRSISKPKTDIPSVLLYSSVNNENWYYLKLEFEPRKSIAVYAKAGYFRDVLPGRQGTLSGMQGLIGISWKTP